MEPTSPPSEPERELFSAVGPFLLLGIGLAFLSAIMAMIAVPASLSHPGDVSAGEIFTNIVRLWPYIVVLASALIGFRRTAGLLALIGGLFGAAWFAFAALFNPDAGPYGFAVLAHLMAAIAGIAEVAHFKTRVSLTPERFAFGGAAAVLVWALGWMMVSIRYAQARHAAEEKQAKQLAEATARREAEATRWAQTDNLHLLIDVGYCLERARAPNGAGPYPHTLAGWRKLGSSAGTERCRSLFTAPDSLGGALVAELSPHATVRFAPPAGRGDPLRVRGYTLELNARWSPSEVQPPPHAPGTISYRVDTSGTVHVTSERRSATDSDRVLPICRSTGGQCLPYLPRQRWGLTPELPKVVLLPIAFNDTVMVGEKAALQLRFAPTSALDSVRGIDVDWGDEHERVSVIPQGSYVAPPRDLTFPLFHAFTALGSWVVRAVVTTRDGSQYSVADTLTVRVRPRQASAVGADSSGRIVRGGVVAQLRQAIANVRSALESQGRPLGKTYSCGVRMRDMGDATDAMNAFESAFPRYDTPSWFVTQTADELPRRALVRLECREP
jgi:hypothetical protein